MTRTRHGEAEIWRMLHDAERALVGGATIPVVCRQLGISEATFHRWRKRYVNDGSTINGGIRSPGRKEDLAERAKELEKENRRLKQLVGQLMLDNALLKDALEATHRR